METLKRLFEEKNYEAVKAEIYSDPDYRNNAEKLRFLVSAYYYLRDFQGTVKAIEELKPFDAKTAYSMLINTEISLGFSADTALGYIDQYLKQDLTEAERAWAYFQRSLCYFAENRKQEAIEILNQTGLLHNAAMESERHFFLNNALDTYEGAITENEHINALIIKARIEKNAPLAREARNRAILANYGEAEYFATVVLGKYLGAAEEKLALREKFGAGEGTLYYRII
jgi:hypothetical protein